MTRSDDARTVRLRKAHDYLLTLGRLTVDFSEIRRAPRYPDGRRESDVEHSFHLAISATELAALLDPKLDVGLVAQFGLVHDLPEVYAGDVWTFNATDAQLAQKKVDEARAIDRLMEELPPHTANLLKHYEEQVLPEARFVRFIDKLLPAVINIMAEDANTFQEDLGVASTKELLAKRVAHLKRLQSMFPEFGDLDELVVAIWETSAKAVFKSKLEG